MCSHHRSEQRHSALWRRKSRDQRQKSLHKQENLVEGQAEEEEEEEDDDDHEETEEEDEESSEENEESVEETEVCYCSSVIPKCILYPVSFNSSH